MLNIILVRTGATEYDHQGRVQGTLDVPLSEDGRQQVERVAAELSDLEVDAVYAGPCRATEESAEILGDKFRLKAKQIDNLRNLDHGLWQGMLIEDVKSKQPKVYRQWQERPETVCPPQGEAIEEVRLRLQKVMAKIAKKHKSGIVAVVVPEPVASLLRNALREDELGNLWQVPSDHQPPWERIEMNAGVASR